MCSVCAFLPLQLVWGVGGGTAKEEVNSFLYTLLPGLTQCALRRVVLCFFTTSRPSSLPKLRSKRKGAFSVFSNALRYSLERGKKKKKEVKAWISRRGH